MNNFTFKLDIVKVLSTLKKGDRVVVGYASTFDIDSDNAQITRGALEGAKNDLLTYSTVLFNHDVDRPIGKVIETDVDDVGLLVKVIISKTEDDIWKKIKEGIINKFSIKGRAIDSSPTEGENQILQIIEIELFEVSLVSVPANKEAHTISHWVSKSLKLVKDAAPSNSLDKIDENKDIEETLNKQIKMKKLIEKLKNAYSKETVEDVKKELDIVIKEIENEKDLIEKLQVLAGKSTGEDKELLDNIIGLLKLKRDKDEEEEEKVEECPSYDLADISEERPVFQLNNTEELINLDEGNKFRKQILKLGKWFHWDADNGVLNITNDVIDNIVKNFKKTVIEHVYVPMTHSSDPGKNVGEVVELKKTKNGLEAVIEIKDESVAEKIKKGLIKCVSASLDPNYRNKKSNKFLGPTLLHTALVSEPFIKGMGNFVPLSEEFEGRSVIQLEDKEPDFFEVMRALKDGLNSMENKMVTSDVFAEEFVDLKKQLGVDKDKEEEKKDGEEETKEEGGEETKEEKEEVEKKTKKEGDLCTVDGKKGKYAKEGDKLVCKSMAEKEIKELAKKTFQSCMSREMKAGKTMAEASKICKNENKKSIDKMFSEESSGKKAEDESEDTAKRVDFADAEKAYEGYLKEGKIVPSQKDAFIKLMTSGKAIELGDNNKVEVSELIKTFMESQGNVINFDEDGVVTDDDEEKEDKEKKKGADLSDVPSDAKEFFGKMGIKDPDAIKRSWKNLEEMKKEEDNEKSSLF